MLLSQIIAYGTAMHASCTFLLSLVLRASPQPSRSSERAAGVRVAFIYSVNLECTWFYLGNIIKVTLRAT